MGFTESQDTSQRERENENEDQAQGPDQGEPAQQAEQPPASAWKGFVFVVLNIVWCVLQCLSFVIIHLSTSVKPYKNTFPEEDNADRTVPVNTLDVNTENEKNFLKNSNRTFKGGSINGSVTFRGYNVANPEDQMKPKQESEKMHPVCTTQGTVTPVVDLSSVSRYSTRSGNPNPSQLRSITMEKHSQSTGSQSIPSGSRNDGITTVKDGESTLSEKPMIHDEVKDTELLKKESVPTECAVDGSGELMGSRETKQLVSQDNVYKKGKSCHGGNRSSSPLCGETDEDRCDMMEKDQLAQSKGDPYKKENSCPSARKSSNNPSGEEDEEHWEVVGKEEILTEVQGDVNKKRKSSMSDGKKGSISLDEKSDEGKSEQVEKELVQSESDLFKKGGLCPSDRKSSKNSSGEEDEEDWEMINEGQLTVFQDTVYWKRKSCPGGKSTSNPFHGETDEGRCDLMENDQSAQSEGYPCKKATSYSSDRKTNKNTSSEEDEDDWEMIDKAQLTDIQDDVYKKEKSCLSCGKRSSSPLYGETDEDRCDMMEKDQLERMEKDQLAMEEPQGSCFTEDSACLSEEKVNCCPLDETDNFVQVKRPDGFPEYSEFGQNSLVDETGYFSEVSHSHHRIDVKVPPVPQRDEVDQFYGKDDNVLMRRKCEKDPLEASASGALPPLKDEVDQFCGKDDNALMRRKCEKDPLEAGASGAPPPLKDDVNQFCGKVDNALMRRKCEKDPLEAGASWAPPPLEGDVNQFCGKDDNALMRRKCEQDSLEAGASGARPKERFPHPSGNIALLPCSEYCTENYWQQVIHQEGEIGRPCSEPCATDYWLQMVIQGPTW